MSSELTAIEVEHVTKSFRVHSEPAKTLKERMLSLHKSKANDFFALKNVNFDVKMGETVGILGHNGSGKSTLLKTIAGTLRPTEGLVRVRGRLSALLELGAGFHPDLTGRENIYLNGSILGFSREHMIAIFDDIVEFSELEDFIDQQVKYYSSGMYARLGFAVAVNLEPDVLLIDEVLAVGDEAFQRKCIERVRGFQEAGRTILLVTHSPEQVRRLCDRVVVLDHGRMIYLGEVNKGVATYRRSLAEKGHEIPDDIQGMIEADEATSAVRFLETFVSAPPDGRENHMPGDRVCIGAKFQSDEQVALRLRLQIHAHDGMLMMNVSNFDVDQTDVGVVADSMNVVQFVINDLPLMDGQYLVTLILSDTMDTFEHDRSQQEMTFTVVSGRTVTGRVDFNLEIETDLAHERQAAVEAVQEVHAVQEVQTEAS